MECMLHFIWVRTDVTFQPLLCDKHQGQIHNEDMQIQDIQKKVWDTEGWAGQPDRAQASAKQPVSSRKLFILLTNTQ